MNHLRDNMTANTKKRRRPSIRLPEYDYSLPGMYFVTICTHKRQCVFGEIDQGRAHLNECAKIAENCWIDLPRHYTHVILDQFVIMPNHVHGIIVLTDDQSAVGAGLKPAPTRPDTTKKHGLSEIVRGFKTFSARTINELRKLAGVPVWQRSYYEHIIRNENSLNLIRRYIIDNPKQWEVDPENPVFSEFAMYDDMKCTKP